MKYNCETDKIRNTIQKYLEGKVIDIGAGGFKVCDSAIAVDGRHVKDTNVVLGDPNMIYHLSKIEDLIEADCVFSSHTLEHLQDDYAAIYDWSLLLKKGGYFILYLPDGRFYNNHENEEHCRDYTYDQFMLFFTRCFCGIGKNYNGEQLKPIFELIESSEDLKQDCYSFYVVAKKI